MRLRQSSLIDLELHFIDQRTNSRGYSEVVNKEIIKFKANLHTKSNIQQSKITGEPDTVLEAYTTHPDIRGKKYVNSKVLNPMSGTEYVVNDITPFTKHSVLRLKSKV